MNKLFFFISLICIVILSLSNASANEKYSFERAKELTPLIEWRDYGPDAFQEALDQNKPIFLLLTAPSWCYWCQVYYESEDYLFHPEVYPYINEHFIPIYVDADKRQDLTRQYLEGGWPSTTVMAPNKERLFGYSGVRPMLNILVNLKKAVEYVNSKNFTFRTDYNYTKENLKILTDEDFRNLIHGYGLTIFQLYDQEYGGFGKNRFQSIQKFPQPRTLDFSLELYESTGDSQWLELVENTLQNQYTKIDEIKTDYNLFDPVEGGFHRYGTKRDWTPPHYEKMLYDNARLLKAYFHLLQIIPKNEIADEVVGKTLTFIENNWYDHENGGFFGNSDVHGEDAYYGKYPRPEIKPRVEKTKYANWNSEAILTYLYLFEKTKDDKYKFVVEDSLNFFKQNMISENGAYHYIKEDGTKSVRGNLLDNAYFMLAFIQAYEVLGDKKYLETARELADYCLENLYDWNSGAFFERNSPDKELYAPGEHILLLKPHEENGIMVYALLKLYKETNNSIYLDSGIKTLGVKIDNIGSLDPNYYYIKSLQLILENDFLNEFDNVNESFEQFEKIMQESFWLNHLLESETTNISNSEFTYSDEGLDKLDSPIILLIIVALIAGLISFASPCTLPILPAYIAYSFKSSKQNIKGMTLSFFIGLTIIFTILGMSATIIGEFFKSHLSIFSQIAGIAIILFGFYILFGTGFTGLRIKNKKPTTYIGSFFFGVIMGISWTPCVGPILVAILLLASTVGSTLSGGILLFTYGVGLALPLILVSFYLEKIDKKSKFWKIIEGKEIKLIGFKIHTSSLISGLLFIILGYLIFSGILFTFNQYLGSTEIQKIFINVEEFVLT